MITVLGAIVAGGVGSRMGKTEMPKQFMNLCGKPVIIHTLEKFLDCKRVSSVIVGINPAWSSYMKEIVDEFFPNSKNIYITDGGADRNDTILNIINYAEKVLGNHEDSILVTHDAVRPFVTEKMILKSISSMDKCDICTAAVPATDTVVVSENGEFVSDFPLRKNVFLEQTPQTFRMGSFREVYNKAGEEERKNITDACKLFYIMGGKVKLIEGSSENIKLTYPSDFLSAEAYMKNK